MGFVTVSAGLGAITSGITVAPELAFYVGLVMWIAGFAIEVIADRQKTAFRADPANADAFITTGLWAWSRHPNYFGEILLWAGIAVIAIPVLQGNQIYLLFSLIWVVVLLTAISGVRMLEGRGNKRWGNDPEYQAYMKRTPMLMLWPPGKNARRHHKRRARSSGHAVRLEVLTTVNGHGLAGYPVGSG